MAKSFVPISVRGKKFDRRHFVTEVQTKGQTGMGFDKVRLDADRPAKSGNCLLNLAQPGQRCAEVGMSLDKVRLDADRPAKSGNCLLKLALTDQHYAEVGKRLGIVRLDADRAAKSGNCLLKLALVPESISEIKEIIRIFCGSATLFAVHERILFVESVPRAACSGQ